MMVSRATLPTYRPRRLRQHEALRNLIRETSLSVEELVMPLFVREGVQGRVAIPSLPGQFQFSLGQVVSECRELFDRGVPAVLLFGIPVKKDAHGSQAHADHGIVQRAVRAIKAAAPSLLVITDVCLCGYTSHGHCGIVRQPRDSSQRHGSVRRQLRARPSAATVAGKAKEAQRVRPATRASSSIGSGRPIAAFEIDNDATLELLAQVAVSHADAGADLVAPSGMMDGNVAAVRQALDATRHDQVPIMAYSVKFASAFYGPFREAAGSTPAFGDRRSYQMDAGNSEEAIREAKLDIEQGADLLMVKPALEYLDIIFRLKQEFHYPVAAFNVSGEYAMIKAAAARGWMLEHPAWMEQLRAIKRAGADVIITYWAKEAARLLRER